jgi:ribosome-binding ATPase YchF (GTP1/OBG family)
MFYRPFQEEVNAMMAAAREEEQKKQARNAAICAKIEEQIKRMENRKVIIVRQAPPPKKETKIDLTAIADMEDDVDGANPQNDLKHLFGKTDSKENLIRRVRGL